MNVIEDITHFMLQCPRNRELKLKLYDYVRDKMNISMDQLPENEQLKVILCSKSLLQYTANYMLKLMERRQ